MKAFAIIKMTGGHPAIDATATPYTGFTFCDSIGQWGGYIVSGTGAQLRAIDDLTDVYGICVVTQDGDKHWPELNNVMATAIRNRLNTWLTARGFSNIPTNWTNKQVILAIFRRLNVDFNINNFDVTDGGIE